jgi:L-threonylcarbamoyladenylate synthase
VDVTGNVVRLLRPGLITKSMLEQAIGTVEVGGTSEGVARSPGQMARHYSPRTKLRLVDRVDLEDHLLKAQASGLRVSVCSLPVNPQQAAALLYETLFQLDQLKLDLILVELPPDTPEWAAIRDRLMRAAAPAS